MDSRICAHLLLLFQQRHQLRASEALGDQVLPNGWINVSP
jgi:hypothetical protein